MHVKQFHRWVSLQTSEDAELNPWVKKVAKNRHNALIHKYQFCVS